ncbi:nadF NAD kinase [Burkholderiales bacterium]|jgi:NAD+ kinase
MSGARPLIAVFGRPQTPGLKAPFEAVVACIRATRPEAEIGIEAEAARGAGLEESPGLTFAPLLALAERASLALVLGGDGTLIGVARQLAPFKVPVIGINMGRLGFMTDLDIQALDTELPPLLKGDGDLEIRSMLHVTVMRRSSAADPWSAVFSAVALNDSVISRGPISRMAELEVFVDGRYMQTLRADGLIVSTPTGSTAYALSASGSILHPSLKGTILVPVAPQALASRPVVLPQEAIVTVLVNDGAGTELHCDMQAMTALEDGDQIVIQAAPDPVLLLHPKGHDYFSVLRRKLHWSANPVHLGRPDPHFPTRGGDPS